MSENQLKHPGNNLGIALLGILIALTIAAVKLIIYIITLIF